MLMDIADTGRHIYTYKLYLGHDVDQQGRTNTTRIKGRNGKYRHRRY